MKKFEENKLCYCGKIHSSSVKDVFTGKGALGQLPGAVKNFGAKKAFLIADSNTYPLAGEKIVSLLKESETDCVCYVFQKPHIEPDEYSVGAAVMHYDSGCDIIIALGSGVINDIAKILSKTAAKPYIIVATAPSMDGYASASSSMAMDGVKVSLNSRCPDVIIGDTDILKTAPLHMFKSGLGDMLAKFVSICEWRISALVTGEYYCEGVAGYIRGILKECIDNAGGLLSKDEKCIEAVFEGLVACGKAMEYAGISRPASGIEHYFSHIWDMRGLEFGIETELHGIQCAVATLYAIKLYGKLKTFVPNYEKAISHAEAFNMDEWKMNLEKFLGKSSCAMIELEKKEKKYDVQSHRERIKTIIGKWDDIIKIIDEELPAPEYFENILSLIEAPQNLAQIGIDEEILPMTFKAAADIRYKYGLCHLAWDLGITEELLK